MTKILLVATGGAIGAVSRYLLGRWIQSLVDSEFPYGTLLVNLLGCFLIGVIMTLVEDRQFFRVEARLFLVTGILGGFTTFSSFGYETMEFLRAGDSRSALANISANVVVGLASVLAGRALVLSSGI